MKKIQEQFKSISIIHIIAIILLFGVMRTLYNYWEKVNEPKESALEILSNLTQKKENSDIVSIEPILVSNKPSNFYTLKVKYKNKPDKIYNLVNENTFQKISDKLLEIYPNDIDISKKLLSTQTIEPYFGLYPIKEAIGLSFTLFMFYYLYSMLKIATKEMLDQFNDSKYKTKPQQDSNKIQPNQLKFKDVAGAEEEKEEMQELVDFLKNPKKYSDMGARIPKGILLSGPPGTGKTLLAKALSGEANVPFFAVSGSEFVEVFVGVGASRVRSLFQMAKKNAPCIIFIDEIEALARQRNKLSCGGNLEQEQTLNQLLVELDGYNQNTGVIVIAATNKPEFLDSAILRPGRFDRQFTVNLPTVKDREAILKLHSTNKILDENVDLKEIARQTPGFSGAQLEGILNEAALLATRKGLNKIDKEVMSEAIDRILIGPAKKSKKYSQKEKKLIVFHEVGHAVVCLKLPEATQKVQKITIIPRGNAGGYNLILDEEEQFLLSKKKLLGEITVCLGGRAAEELFLDDISSGAYIDLKKATRIARTMVTKFGMSVVGLTQFSEGEQQFHKNFSDSKALEIDQAIQDIISNCYKLAKKIISENKDLLMKISEYLFEIETLSKKDIEEIYNTGKLEWFEKEKELSKNKNKENTDFLMKKEKIDISNTEEKK